MKPVKKKAKTFTTEQLIKWLNAKYGSKLTGQPFNENDISQYLERKMLPFRYSGKRLTCTKANGKRIITMSKNIPE